MVGVRQVGKSQIILVPLLTNELNLVYVGGQTQPRYRYHAKEEKSARKTEPKKDNFWI